LVSTSKYYTWIDTYNTDYSIEKGRKILAFIDEGRLTRGWLIKNYDDADVLLNDFNFVNTKTVINMSIGKEKISIPIQSYPSFNGTIHSTIYSLNEKVINASSYNDDKISLLIDDVSTDNVDIIIDAKEEGIYQIVIRCYSNGLYKMHMLLIDVER
jgi:hypothetical protein